MARTATAWILIVTTLAGPSICCCTLGKVESWVSVCLGHAPVTCQASECCHDEIIAHGHSHAAKHDHHAHAHEHPDAGQLAGKTSRDDQRQQVPHQCPCRQDHIDESGLPITDCCAAKTITAPLDLAWVTFTLDNTAVSPTLVDSGVVASLYCPAGVCSVGREILRAYSVLRI